MQNIFRRVVVREQQYTCLNSGTCKNLSDCRACRFDKCFCQRRLFLMRNSAQQSSSLSKAHVVSQDIVKSQASKRTSKYSFPPNTSMTDLLISQKNLLDDIAKNNQNALPFDPNYSVPYYIQLGVFLNIEGAKALPVYKRLSTNHRFENSTLEILLKNMSLVNTLLLDAFYSFELKQETIVYPNGAIAENMKDHIISNQKTLYSSISKHIWRIGPSIQEFVLLKAIIYSSSAVGDMDLEDKELLKTEEERFTKMLMSYLQNKMGLAAGAKKFSELMSLIFASTSVSTIRRRSAKALVIDSTTGWFSIALSAMVEPSGNARKAMLESV
uniref:Nuclear receptor domain-containing protein n=1 Tax=Ditylenchus dipsaci TaxID=166011 RepID=A0A915D9X4_9BILA